MAGDLPVSETSFGTDGTRGTGGLRNAQKVSGSSLGRKLTVTIYSTGQWMTTELNEG